MDCNNITKDGLVIEFDVRTENLGIILNTQPQTIIEETVLLDYGLTEYDLAKTNNMNNSITLINEPLKLVPAQYFNSSGTVDIFSEIITNDTSIGKYVTLNNSYYNTVYKYGNNSYINDDFTTGISIEMSFKIEADSLSRKSTIFYMGTRGVDKYNVYDFNYPFTTEESEPLVSYKIYTEVDDEEVGFILLNETLTINEEFKINFKGKPNVEKVFLYLNNQLINQNTYTVDYRLKEITFTGLPEGTEISLFYYVFYDEGYVKYGVDFNNLVYYTKPDDDIIDNYFKIAINTNGGLEISFYDGKIKSFHSSPILKLGWNHIILTLKPYDIRTIQDDCNFSTNSTLNIYLNGLSATKHENVPYINFKGLETLESRQIGLPYNIFWGGDTFGLNHSYVFNNIDKYSSVYDVVNYDGVIENSYNESFNGSLQVLRIYNRSISFNEIKNNYKIESQSLNINKNKGGRLIYV